MPSPICILYTKWLPNHILINNAHHDAIVRVKKVKYFIKFSWNCEASRRNAQNVLQKSLTRSSTKKNDEKNWVKFMKFYSAYNFHNARTKTHTTFCAIHIQHISLRAIKMRVNEMYTNPMWTISTEDCKKKSLKNQLLQFSITICNCNDSHKLHCHALKYIHT